MKNVFNIIGTGVINPSDSILFNQQDFSTGDLTFVNHKSFINNMTSNTLDGQPTNNGIVCNLNNGGDGGHALWMGLLDGDIYHKGYDTATSDSSWYRLLDTKFALKKIWSGSWSSGSINVSELLNYRLYYLDLADTITSALIVRESSAFRGSSGYVSSVGNPYVIVFSATISGTSLTYEACDAIRLDTGATNNSNIAVNSIYGIL